MLIIVLNDHKLSNFIIKNWCNKTYSFIFKKLKLKYDAVVDLDASPLRTKNDDKAINIFLKENLQTISGNISRKNPYFNQVMFKKNKLSLVCDVKKLLEDKTHQKYMILMLQFISGEENILYSNKLINNKTIFWNAIR